MSGLRLGIVLVCLAASTAPARAETAEAEVERLANDAVNAYRGADYRRAVELLQRAYDIRQVPALLYNMAKAYDKLGDVDHAYQSYRHYVDSAAADPKLKARAEARIAALAEQRKKNAPPPEPPRPAVVAPPPPTPAVVTPPPPPAPSPEEVRARLHDDFVRKRHRARLVALGVGAGTAACAIVAVSLGADALALHKQFNTTTSPDDKARLKSDATLRAAVSDGFWAATAVGAAVTGYFLYRGFRHEPPSLALVPALSPASAGLALTGRY